MILVIRPGTGRAEFWYRKNMARMHELSIIHSILDATEKEVRQRDKKMAVAAIELEIGELAGVEISSLEFIWPAVVEYTLLENAECSITRVPGSAVCTTCGHIYGVRQYFDPCPQCGSHWNQITKGEELRIKSLTLVSENQSTINRPKVCVQPVVAAATDIN